jgi:Tfp pilus assembly protein PilO
MSRNRLFLILAVLASVVVATGGFFLGVQPQLAQAAANDAQSAASEQTNAQNTRELERLRKANETLGQQKDDLTRLEKSVPAQLDAPAFYSEVDGAATTSGVTITAITTGDAVAYAPPTTPSATTGTAASSPSATPAPADGAAATPAPTAAATPSAPEVATSPLISGNNFSAVPVSIAITGTFDESLAFLRELRSGERLYLIQKIDSSTSSGAGDAADTAGAGGATGAKGSSRTAAEVSTTWTFSGFIYVLQDVDTTKAEQSTSAGAGATSAPSASATPAANG